MYSITTNTAAMHALHQGCISVGPAVVMYTLFDVNNREKWRKGPYLKGSERKVFSFQIKANIVNIHSFP